jgi:hypothetical protein
MAAKKGAKKPKEDAGVTPPIQEPKVIGQEPAVETPKGANLDFAVNAVKLNRAKAHVQKMAPTAKGAEFAALVKERYVEIGGLLNADKPVGGTRRAKMTGRVVNLSDNDGSKD